MDKQLLVSRPKLCLMELVIKEEGWPKEFSEGTRREHEEKLKQKVMDAGGKLQQNVRKFERWRQATAESCAAVKSLRVSRFARGTSHPRKGGGAGNFEYKSKRN